MKDAMFIQYLTEQLEAMRSMSEQIVKDNDNRPNEFRTRLDEISAQMEKYKKEYIDFRQICDHLNTTLFVADDKGQTIYVNPAYRQRTGLEKLELEGKTIEELQNNNVIQCDVIPRILRDKKALNAIGYVVPTEYRGFISGIPILDEAGEIQYVMTTDWDVNTIMEMENHLQHLKRGDTVSSDRTPEQNELPYEDEILYISDQMRKLMSLTKTVAQTDVSVLITGETGTGKELLANTIVRYSNRAEKPFVKINCAAIPANLLESELFGYTEGAFTGAQKGGKIGAFELADGGTIFLDEIGELPFQVQAKLLRALQESEIIRIGGHQPVKLNLRIIAATNRNLLHEIKEGNFREDLYYRLNIIPLDIPPLRKRAEDIPFLIGRFLELFDEKYHKTTFIESNVMRLLQGYGWPGNIRELRNFIERMVILSNDGRITVESVENILSVSTPDDDHSYGKSLKDAVEDLEMWMIKNAINEYGNKKKAAEALGVDRTTLVKKCQRYGIE